MSLGFDRLTLAQTKDGTRTMSTYEAEVGYRAADWFDYEDSVTHAAQAAQGIRPWQGRYLRGQAIAHVPGRVAYLLSAMGWGPVEADDHLVLRDSTRDGIMRGGSNLGRG